jgi:hypothetical protein
MARRKRLGRMIDTFAVTAGGGAYQCDLYLEEADDGRRFHADCDELGLRARTYAGEARTIEEVREELEGLVRSHAGVAWRGFFLVEYGGTVAGVTLKFPRTEPGQSVVRTQLGLNVRLVQLADDPRLGGKRHRFGLRTGDGREASLVGWPLTGAGDGSGSVYRADPLKPVAALVEATPVNREVLRMLLDALRRLDAVMRRFLAPEDLPARLALALSRGLEAIVGHSGGGEVGRHEGAHS